MKKFYQRKSPRLEGYDYSQSGAYFVTICTHKRKHLFGKIMEDVLILSQAGQIASARWEALPEHHSHISLDHYVIMPNHMHAIIYIDNDSRVASTISSVIGSYKSSVTRYIRQALSHPELIVWQSRFHDHIIRNEKGLNMLRNYVIELIQTKQKKDVVD